MDVCHHPEILWPSPALFLTHNFRVSHCTLAVFEIILALDGDKFDIAFHDNINGSSDIVFYGDIDEAPKDFLNDIETAQEDIFYDDIETTEEDIFYDDIATAPKVDGLSLSRVGGWVGCSHF